MRKILCMLLALAMSLQLSAQMRWNEPYQQYINQYRDLAIQQMMRFGVPASITLAQGLLESGAGRSRLATLGNNHFGIKCHGWTGRTIAEDDDARGECFRAYDNALQSFDDHSRFLRGSSRYSRLFSLDKTDYRGWARGLKAAGYATNPRYADKLIEIIELYKLYAYDRAQSFDKFMAEHAGVDRPAVQGGTLHPIHLFNKNYYINARPGDTFKLIGEEIGISGRKIARYNERSYKDQLVEGEIIYLKKKQKKAPKTFKNRPHRVKEGESMYTIAQTYGVRLKSLYKKNRLQADYQLRVGDLIRVY